MVNITKAPALMIECTLSIFRASDGFFFPGEQGAAYRLDPGATSLTMVYSIVGKTVAPPPTMVVIGTAHIQRGDRISEFKPG